MGGVGEAIKPGNRTLPAGVAYNNLYLYCKYTVLTGIMQMPDGAIGRSGVGGRWVLHSAGAKESKRGK